jgi:2-polyprenyl-6-methoxyphenol hydroxylase-like FAD-dependent oxidoreductase
MAIACLAYSIVDAGVRQIIAYGTLPSVAGVSGFPNKPFRKTRTWRLASREVSIPVRLLLIGDATHTMTP